MKEQYFLGDLIVDFQKEHFVLYMQAGHARIGRHKWQYINNNYVYQT